MRGSSAGQVSSTGSSCRDLNPLLSTQCPLAYVKYRPSVSWAITPILEMRELRPRKGDITWPRSCKVFHLGLT